MKTEIVLNIGGKLQIGDVVGICGNNYIDFGWFVESGLYGSLKYISFITVHAVVESYNSFLKEKEPSPYLIKKFGNGLNFKNFSKDYVLKYDSFTNRAFKINNPEEFFKDAGTTETRYLNGKKQLNDVKFPAK